MSAFPVIPPGEMLIIRVDGTRQTVPRKGADIEKLIGARGLDFVTLTYRSGREPDLVMAVDDSGWETRTVDHGNGRIVLEPIRPRGAINPDATIFYHAITHDGTTHQIVGDVAIMHDRDAA
jgi:hypothetical protein